MNNFTNNVSEWVNDAYSNYHLKTMFKSDLKWLNELEGVDFKTGEKVKVYRQFSKEEFFNKIKTDSEFASQWGIETEKRELSLEERKLIAKQILPILDTFLGIQSEEGWVEQCEKLNVPTKVISLTYNNETIESCE